MTRFHVLWSAFFRKRLFPTKRLPCVHDEKLIMHNQPRIKSRLSCKKRDYTYVGIAEENVYYSVQKCVNIILVSISICLQRFFVSVVHLFVYDCMLNTNFLLFEFSALCDFYFGPIGWPSECDTLVAVLPRNTMTTLCRITYSL